MHYSQTMTFLALIIICFTIASRITAIRVGIIQNASIINLYSNLTMNASTCNECLCTMMTSTENLTILSFNCYTNNNSSVSCELFTTATYLSSSLYRMETNSSFTFYFQQLPSINQSETTAATTIAAPEGMDLALIGIE